jgi:hypothetical protein
VPAEVGVPVGSPVEGELGGPDDGVGIPPPEMFQVAVPFGARPAGDVSGCWSKARMTATTTTAAAATAAAVSSRIAPIQAHVPARPVSRTL